MGVYTFAIATKLINIVNTSTSGIHLASQMSEVVQVQNFLGKNSDLTYRDSYIHWKESNC